MEPFFDNYLPTGVSSVNSNSLISMRAMIVGKILLAFREKAYRRSSLNDSNFGAGVEWVVWEAET